MGCSTIARMRGCRRASDMGARPCGHECSPFRSPRRAGPIDWRSDPTSILRCVLLCLDRLALEPSGHDSGGDAAAARVRQALLRPHDDTLPPHEHQRRRRQPQATPQVPRFLLITISPPAACVRAAITFLVGATIVLKSHIRSLSPRFSRVIDFQTSATHFRHRRALARTCRHPCQAGIRVVSLLIREVGLEKKATPDPRCRRRRRAGFDVSHHAGVRRLMVSPNLTADLELPSPDD